MALGTDARATTGGKRRFSDAGTQAAICAGMAPEEAAETMTLLKKLRATPGSLEALAAAARDEAMELDGGGPGGPGHERQGRALRELAAPPRGRRASAESRGGKENGDASPEAAALGDDASLARPAAGATGSPPPPTRAADAPPAAAAAATAAAPVPAPPAPAPAPATAIVAMMDTSIYGKGRPAGLAEKLMLCLLRVHLIPRAEHLAKFLAARRRGGRKEALLPILLNPRAA